MLDFIAWTILGLLLVFVVTAIVIEYGKYSIRVIVIIVSITLVAWAIIRLFIN